MSEVFSAVPGTEGEPNVKLLKDTAVLFTPFYPWLPDLTLGT